MELPVAGSYHTELAAYTALRTGDERLELRASTVALGAFYGGCDVVLSPSRGVRRAAAEMGIAQERIGRWDRGVDVARFSPALRDAARPGGRVHVLYAGRLTEEKGADLLADAFLAARARDPRLHLCSPAAARRRSALRAPPRRATRRSSAGSRATSSPRAYATADLFLFCSQTDTFGQVILEAQASGLPVVAVAAGGPPELIADGRSGVLCPPRREALADARRRPRARSPRPRAAASAAVAAGRASRERTWEGSPRARRAAGGGALAARRECAA